MSFAAGMKTIVVATDLSGNSEAALEYAKKLAKEYGSRIVLAHGPDPINYAAVDTIPIELRAGLSEPARAALDKLSSDLLQDGIRSHSEVRQGMVAEMLVDVAILHKAGLIVIGTKGIGGAGPVIVGSVAERLVRLSPCPVLAVAADWNAGEFSPIPGGPVLLAIEGNAATQAAVETAFSLAEKFQRTLQVLHACEPCEASFILNSAATSMEKYGIPVNQGVQVRFALKDGEPADAIAEAIGKYHPCILVAGVKRASDTPGPHGTIFSLLARSRVPVLCVPPKAGLGADRRDSSLTAERVLCEVCASGAIRWV